MVGNIQVYGRIYLIGGLEYQLATRRGVWMIGYWYQEENAAHFVLCGTPHDCRQLIGRDLRYKQYQNRRHASEAMREFARLHLGAGNAA